MKCGAQETGVPAHNTIQSASMSVDLRPYRKQKPKFKKIQVKKHDAGGVERMAHRWWQCLGSRG